MADENKPQQDGSLMSKLLALEAQGEREIADNKVLIEVGQDGLDKLKALHPNWGDYSLTKKVGIAKNTDPVVMSMAKDYKKKDMTYDVFEDAYSLDNPKNKYTEHQLMKYIQYSNSLLERGIKLAEAQGKVDTDERKIGKYRARAGMRNNTLNALLYNYSTTKDDSVRAEAIDVGLQNFIYSNIDISTGEGQKYLNSIDRKNQDDISIFVDEIDISKFGKQRQVMKYPIGTEGEMGEVTIEAGDSEEEIKRKIKQALLGRLQGITSNVINAANVKKVEPSEYKEEELDDLEIYEIK